MFNFIPVLFCCFFFVNFRFRFGLGLGFGFAFGIGNLKVALPAQWTVPVR